jgi:hypothetical protein
MRLGMLTLHIITHVVVQHHGRCLAVCLLVSLTRCQLIGQDVLAGVKLVQEQHLNAGCPLTLQTQMDICLLYRTVKPQGKQYHQESMASQNEKNNHVT